MTTPPNNYYTDIAFELSDEQNEAFIHVTRDDGRPLVAQDILDAVVDALQLQFGVLPTSRDKLNG